MRPIAVWLTVLLMLPVPAMARPDARPASPLTLSAGLEARIGVVGRNAAGDYVSAAIQIENKGRHPVQIMLVGPAPYAADNAGATYEFDRFSGAASCGYLEATQAASCIGHDAETKYTKPLELFTQIDPGAVASMTFGLKRAKGSKGTLLSLAATFAYRIVPDLARDVKLSDEERRKSIRTMSISFPSFPLR